MTAQAGYRTDAARRAFVAIDEDCLGLDLVVQAGARARQVAASYHAAGVGAVLLDGAGRVLHVGAHASRSFAGVLRVEAGHVIGRDADANRAIEAVLSPILVGSAPPTAPLTAEAAAGGPFLSACAYDDGMAGQLLRAVLLVARTRQGLRAALVAQG